MQQVVRPHNQPNHGNRGGYLPTRSAPRSAPRPVPRPAPPQGLPPQRRQRKGSARANWIILGVLSVLTMAAFTCMAVVIGVVVIANSGVYPGVRVAGVSLSGLSAEEAADALSKQLTSITLRDAERTWRADLTHLGIQVDYAATARRAFSQGRGEGGLVEALLGNIEVAPVITVDSHALRAGLQQFATQINLTPVNAGVEFVDGQVRATQPVNGRVLDIEATAAHIERSSEQSLSNGVLNLAMRTVPPDITDSTPMVAAASQLLQHPLTVRAFDPATGHSVYWSVPPERWASWLTAQADPTSSTGLRLALQSTPVQNFLNDNAAIFDNLRYLNLDEAVENIQARIAANITSATIRVYHRDRQHVVQPGESIVSIAWDYGVPYPWVQQSNPGVQSLSIGQTITIPSVDNFMPYAPVPDKRIVVSISDQRTRVYENGALIWDWASSTGIDSSPTWPGIYQVISHEPNAYAGNWNLWMPNFMGVYQPVPGADFTNGFHGYPTRGGGQLLWQNSLGRKVTYGCILLDNSNVQQLYDWAETGVVVEIRA